jgi:hypothetical protein
MADPDSQEEGIADQVLADLADFLDADGEGAETRVSAAPPGLGAALADEEKTELQPESESGSADVFSPAATEVSNRPGNLRGASSGGKTTEGNDYRSGGVYAVGGGPPAVTTVSKAPSMLEDALAEDDSSESGTFASTATTDGAPVTMELESLLDDDDDEDVALADSVADALVPDPPQMTEQVATPISRDDLASILDDDDDEDYDEENLTDAHPAPVTAKPMAGGAVLLTEEDDEDLAQGAQTDNAGAAMAGGAVLLGPTDEEEDSPSPAPGAAMAGGAVLLGASDDSDESEDSTADPKAAASPDGASAPEPISMEAPAPEAGAEAKASEDGTGEGDALDDLDMSVEQGDMTGPLDLAEFSANLKRHVDPKSPPPARMMAAKAMVPMGPKDMALVVYQLMFDKLPKVAAAAEKTFAGFDDRILNAIVAEKLPPPVLQHLATVVIDRSFFLEKVLLNRDTPDMAYVNVGRHCTDAKMIGIVAGNQERLLRNHDIVRAIRGNPAAMRSELDRAIDFMVREGIFLEDVPEFLDSFTRLGKKEAMAAVSKIEIGANMLTDAQKKEARETGKSAEEVLLQETEGVESIEDAEERMEAVDGQEEEAAEEAKRMPLAKYPIPVQIKLAMVGDHGFVLEGLKSTNRMVASAAIRNPKVTENDVRKIAKSRTLHDDVVRYMCNNKDWTRSYAVKKALVENPKTPMSLVTRWIGLMRAADLKALSKSKQVPSAVSTMAKRLLQKKEGRSG